MLLLLRCARRCRCSVFCCWGAQQCLVQQRVIVLREVDVEEPLDAICKAPHRGRLLGLHEGL